MSKLSFILPAKNEAAVIGSVIDRLHALQLDAEIIVVNDGSTDNTAEVAANKGAKVITHPYSQGNGAAVRAGARAAQGEVLVFLDADGQHRPEDIPRLLAKLDEGYAMVVGARTGLRSQANVHRAVANRFYNRFGSWMVGHQILDLTSGFRAVKASVFRRFLYLLPNGFSYPTTITMCLFRSGFPVAYEPIEADKRVGKSHMRIFHDGIRFLLIIFKIGTLFSPLKLFMPCALGFLLTGLGYYAYTFVNYHRFTNMSALLFIAAIVVFLIGLVSEQITALMYKDTES